MLSVLLVDDHAALRDGLGVLLERRGMRVVAAVGTAAEASVKLAECAPDVAILDIDLPDRDGFELLREVRAAANAPKTLLYTGSQDARTLADALESGAEGIVLKPTGLGALVDAVRAVGRGERHIDPAIAEIQAVADDESLLSGRERQIFALLARGDTGEEIAERLEVSPETVRTHVRNAMGKLQARTRTEAVVKALSSGEIEPS